VIFCFSHERLLDQLFTRIQSCLKISFKIVKPLLI
jgi:hypothetical protein